ncbi:MAG: hypothetical protein MZV49_09305 [Rhodopseudomonas palustris]|nr:hypothetical protein [Rhodopseudomonas palustris]
MILLIEFIKKIDVPQRGRRYYSFRLNSIKAKEFIALCPTRIFPVPPILLADEYAFAASLSDEGKTELDTLIALLDVKRQAYPVLLRYLKNEDFVKLCCRLFPRMISWIPVILGSSSTSVPQASASSFLMSFRLLTNQSRSSGTMCLSYNLRLATVLTMEYQLTLNPREKTTRFR